jgi:hypothetical protein
VTNPSSKPQNARVAVPWPFRRQLNVTPSAAKCKKHKLGKVHKNMNIAFKQE